MFLGLECQRKS